MPGVKELAKDFYAKYDPEGFSEEKITQIDEYYKGDVSALAKDFYAKYDPDGFSEEKLVSVVDYYSGKKKSQEEPTTSVSDSSEDGVSRSKEIDFSEIDFSKPPTEEDADKIATQMEENRFLPVDNSVSKEKEADLISSEDKSIIDKPKIDLTGKEQVSEEESVQFNVDNLFKGDEELSDYLLADDRSPRNEEVLSKYYKTAAEYHSSDKLEKKIQERKEEGLPLDVAKDIALDEMSQEAYDLSMVTRDLAPGEMDEYSESINTYVDLMSKHSAEGDTLTSEERQSLVKANNKIREIRKGHDLVNPLTGNVDKAYTEKIDNITTGYKKETDFNKLKSSYLAEYSKMGFIYSEYEDEINKYAEQERAYNKRTGADKDWFTSDNPLQRMLALKNLKDKNLSWLTSEYQTATPEEKQESKEIQAKVLEYEKSFNEYLGISNALVFNDDPGTVNRGFQALNGASEDDFINSTGKFVNALGETFKEEMSGREVFSDRDFAKTYAKIANENGIKTTPEQVEAAKNEFSENLGDAGAITGSIMFDIIVSAALTRNASSLAGVPKAISKIKALSTSPKLAKAVGRIYEGVMQGVAFDLADDRTGFAMGATEYGVGELFKGALNAVTKGKSSKFLKLAAELTGRTAGGLSEEYMGDLADTAIDSGLFSDETFDKVIGKNPDEAWEKFAITGLMSLAFGGAGSLSSFVSNNEEYVNSLEGESKTHIEQLIAADKELIAAEKKAQEKEELVPFEEEVSKDGKTFLTSSETTEGDTISKEETQEVEREVDIEELEEITNKLDLEAEDQLVDNIDEPMSHKGENGVIRKEGDIIVFESPTRIVEFGTVEEIGDKSLAKLNLSPIEIEAETTTEVTEDVTPEETESKPKSGKELTHEGKDYTILRGKRNKKGEAILTVKEVDTGFQRKLKGDVAEEGLVILEESKVDNAIKAEEKAELKREEKESSKLDDLIAEEEYNNKTEAEVEAEVAKAEAEVVKFEEELTDVVLKEQQTSQEKGLVISEGDKKFLVRKKPDGTHAVTTITADGKKIPFTGKANLKTRESLIEQFKQKVSTAEDIALEEAAGLTEEFKKEQSDKILNFLDSAIESTSSKGRAFDASIGLPLAVANTALKIIKASYKAGKSLALAIQDGMAHVKKMGYDVSDHDFQRFVVDSLSKKAPKVKGKTQGDDKGVKQKPDNGKKTKDFKKGRQAGRKEVKQERNELQSKFSEYVKGKTKEIRELSPKLTATVLQKALNLKTTKGLESAKKYVNKVLDNKKFRDEQIVKSENIDFINKALDKKNWKKKGENKGKISNNSQEFLQKAYAASKLTREQAIKKQKQIIEKADKQEEGITVDQLEEVIALDFAEMESLSVESLISLKKEIKQQLQTGRAGLAAKLAAAKAENKRVRDKTVNANTNFGENKTTPLDEKGMYTPASFSDSWNKASEWFGTKTLLGEIYNNASVNHINAYNAGFIDMLSIINFASANNTPGGVQAARSILEEEYYRPLVKAQNNRTVAIRRKLQKVQENKLKIFGDHKDYDSLNPAEKKKAFDAKIEAKVWDAKVVVNGKDQSGKIKKQALQRQDKKNQIAEELDFFKQGADKIGVDTSVDGWQYEMTSDQIDLVESLEKASLDLSIEHNSKLKPDSKNQEGDHFVPKDEDVVARAKKNQLDKWENNRKNGTTKADRKKLEAIDEFLNEKHIILNDKGEPILDDSGRQMKISKNTAISIYNWAQNNESLAELDAMSSSNPNKKAFIDKAMDLVSNDPKLLKQADWTMDFYKDYHPEISNAHKEFNNLALYNTDNYTPLKRIEKETSTKEADADLLSIGGNIASTRNGALETRQKSNQPLDLSVNSDASLRKYIEDMEHFIHMTPIARKMNSGLLNAEVRNSIRQNNGEYMNIVIGKMVNDLTRGSIENKKDSPILNYLRSAVTTKAIALNIPVYFKQLTSALAYSAETNTFQITKATAKMLTGNKELMEDWKEIASSDFIQERQQKGYSLDMKEVTENFAKLKGKKQEFLNKLMVLTKKGDIHAILIGGVPFYHTRKKHHEKTMTKAKAKEEAFLDFLVATRNAQQSTEISELTHIQRSGDTGKIFTMFKTSTRQYQQKTAMATRNARRKRESAIDAKRLMMFGATLPIAFALASKGIRSYDEDDYDDLVKAVTVSNLTGTAYLGDIANYSAGYAFDSGFDYQASPALDVTAETFKSAVKLAFYDKTKETLPDGKSHGDVIMDLATPLVELSTGLPLKRIREYLPLLTPKQIKRVLSGEATDKEVMRYFGYTKFALKMNKKKSKKDKVKKPRVIYQ
ncbi:hypothetical protein N9924_00075 [bacterium]|nr:hypothetical protein [bacterium]